jgi:hypothetical protein
LDYAFIIIIIIQEVTCDQNIDFEVIKGMYTAEHLVSAVTAVEIHPGDSKRKCVEPLQGTLLPSQEMSFYFLWPFKKRTEWHLKLYRKRFLSHPFLFVVC